MKQLKVYLISDAFIFTLLSLLYRSQAMAQSGKSELDAKHKSLIHQYEQIKFNKSHNTNSASLQRLSFFCNILDLVNCVLWETSVLILFSTCMTKNSFW